MKKLFYQFGLLVVVSLFLNSCGATLEAMRQATTDEGVVINGVRWATRNVERSGSFVVNPEDVGMLFQWNNRTAWQLRDFAGAPWAVGNFTWNREISYGTEWNPRSSPCPPGWRVPTIEEMQSLVNAGSEWTVRNEVPGRLFGTAPYQIFLPVAGSRGGNNGALTGIGVQGLYWSSTDVRDENLDRARRLFFNESEAGETVNPADRGSAFTIRCVAE